MVQHLPWILTVASVFAYTLMCRTYKFIASVKTNGSPNANIKSRVPAKASSGGDAYQTYAIIIYFRVVEHMYNVYISRY